MKYLKQMVYILLFSFAGELLAYAIPLPIPAAIYGIVLLFVALCTGVLKTEKVADTARFLVKIMPLLFVAPAVNILRYWDLIAPEIGAICVITVSSTVVVFAVAGSVTQLLRKGERADG